MTVIAYRDGVMAADSMEADDHQKFLSTKLFKAKGAVIGTSGDSVNSLLFVDWYGNRKKPKPDLSIDRAFECLVATTERLELWTEMLRPQVIDAEYYAIGSGASVALGAMHAGADAELAVEAACHFARGCREPVQVEVIKPRKDVECEFSPVVRLAAKGVNRK